MTTIKHVMKRCPFCGGYAKMDKRVGAFAVRQYAVFCMDCGAQTALRTKEQDAVDAWNKRFDK